MRRPGDQDGGLCPFERLDQSGWREQIEQTGGCADRKAELQGVKTVQMRVGGKAQNAVIGPQAEFRRAEARVAEKVIGGDRHRLGGRGRTRGVEKKKWIVGIRRRRWRFSAPLGEQRREIDRARYLAADGYDQPQSRKAFAQRDDVARRRTILGSRQCDRGLAAAMRDQMLELANAV